MTKGYGWWTRLRRRFSRSTPSGPVHAVPLLASSAEFREPPTTEAPTTESPNTEAPTPPRRRRESKRRAPAPTPAVIALPDHGATAHLPTAHLSNADPVTPVPKTIALALQGGGAHGAFTWGVLDRLLEEDGLDIVAISGASAGAMNAAMLALGWGAGHRDGPRAGARAALDRFWTGVSVAGGGLMAPVRPTVLDRLTGNWNVDRSPYSQMFESVRRMVAPYDVQPPDYHPMRRLLSDMVDVDAIRRSGIRLFVAATNVRTGRLRLFDETELDVKPLLASACLPSLFQAIEIEGEHYWDGGYVANPALFPLRRATPEADIVLISLSPLITPEVPKDVEGIAARLSQITFNAVLMRELEDIAENPGPTRLHHIEAQDAMRALGHYSKMMTDSRFLTMLRETGRIAADRWLADHKADIGERSTFTLATKTGAETGAETGMETAAMPVPATV